MSDETRNANKEFEEALEKHKAELKRREELRIELEKGNDQYKREAIIDLYEKLRATGFPRNLIPSHLQKALEGYISRRHINRTIEEITRIISSTNRDISQNNDKDVIEESYNKVAKVNEPMVMSHDGSIVAKDELDSIYGRDPQMMKREVDRVIEKDNQETLENPINKIPLLSDTPHSIREKLAKIEEQEQTIAILKEERDTAVAKHKEILATSRNRLLNDNAELKAKVSNLETILYESNEQIRQEHAFKEFEILKLDKIRDNQIRTLSTKAIKTIFLWVNPKTMEILEIKTDTEHHRITEIRRREKIASFPSTGVISGTV